MSKVVINFLKRAEEDLEDIYRYIAKELQSPQAAMRQFDSIAEAIQTLEVFPERCAIVEELLVLGIKVRRLLVKNYSIFYRFDNDTVTILRVLHQSRNVDRLIDEIGKDQ
ncbi:type II toxin-antitoxin system RelE/ParE family toxin [Streptococcus ovis]|uniref:type II toxin-antitoxin system RelE/ParE family toxin n=1 Tax=Streptococcus ovis TaxID=82806 RepID=UPI00037E1526|nr:type II toxin-antitoxin system RelE/ParE family toxin [Streptococcus ovis]